VGNIQITFSARLSKYGTNLDLFALVHAQPHQLYIETNDTLELVFRPPFGQNKLPDLEVSHQEGDVYHVITTSHFPENVKYEREFRIRVNLTQPSPHRGKYRSLNAWLLSLHILGVTLFDIKQASPLSCEHFRDFD
jgi:hypothetical protein